jgi:flavin-binding protein dodecin
VDRVAVWAKSEIHRRTRHRLSAEAPNVEEVVVSDATYKVTEVVGTSTESIQKAVRNGIARASKTLRNLDWFEVTDIRGHIVDGDVGHFQVTMKIGFKMEG